MKKSSKTISVLIILLIAPILLTTSLNDGDINYNLASGGTLNVPVTYTTIQEAINAANDGDTVNVAAGTYYENLIVNKSITLQGAGRDATIINGQYINTTIAIQRPNVVVTGFEVSYGKNESIRIVSPATNCQIYNNKITFGFERGVAIFSSTYDQIYDNIVHDIGFSYPGSHGGIESLNSNNIDVYGNTVYSCSTWGIGTNNAHSIKIYNNTIYSTIGGILLEFGSHNEQIYNNYIYNVNNSPAINLLNSANNNSISNNIIQGCDQPINLGLGAHDNLLSNNALQNGNIAFRLNSTYANTIVSNNITNNNVGFQLSDSSANNIIYNNTLFDTRNNVVILNSLGSNIWNNGYPYGGNYWSGYIGKDIFTGSSQNVFGSDKIGDTAYVIDANNIDHYPMLATSVPATDTFSFSPYSPTPNQLVSFDASAETSSSGNFTYLWLFGDGTNATITTPRTTHQYSTTGTYTVSLTVIDQVGGQIQRTSTVTIAPNPTPTSQPTPHPTTTPTNQTTPTPIPEESPTPTPEPTTIEGAPPLIRSLSLNPSIINLPANPLNPQTIAITSTAAGAVGLVSIVTVAATQISRSTSGQIDSSWIPKPLQSLAKKIAEKRLESMFEKNKLNPKKHALITRKEAVSFSMTVLFMSLVVGFVMADGLPNVLDPLVFLRFFAIAFASTVIVQTAAFILDIGFSMRSTVRKQLSLWRIGSALYFISGLILKFPFSSPATSKTLGSYRYKMSGQKKINAYTAIAKALILSWFIVPFALMGISGIDYLIAIGSAGMLSVLTVVCFSLIPLAPSPGKDVYVYNKSLGFGGIVLSVCLLIIYYLGWLTFWGYLAIGLVATFILPSVLHKIEREKRLLRQTDTQLWFT
jgi:parallel beta-helix repeat protein